MPDTDLLEQARALRDSVGVRLRGDLQVVRLEGDDQRSWLNGQVTNDVRHTQSGDGVYCLAVNVRGKVMADVWVLDDGEALRVLLPRDAAPSVLESFESQIIMEDVELVPEPESDLISIQGPLCEEVVAALSPAAGKAFRCDELGAGGRHLLVAHAERDQVLQRCVEQANALGGGIVDDAGFQLARLRAGRPRFGQDFGDRNYPQEAGLKRLAVSFNKGCYLGQEVVCTLENRGRLSRQLLRLKVIEGATAPGDEINDAEGKRVGELTSYMVDEECGYGLALGYVKTIRAEAGTELRSGDARLSVLGPAGG